MENNESKNKDENKKNILFEFGKFNLSRKSFWTIVIIYSSIVLILKYKFNSKIAEFLYQISFFAASIIVIFIIYRILKVTSIHIKNKYFK